MLVERPQELQYPNDTQGNPPSRVQQNLRKAKTFMSIANCTLLAVPLVSIPRDCSTVEEMCPCLDNHCIWVVVKEVPSVDGVEVKEHGVP